jgi:lactoylglutathione lyase
MAAGAFTFTKLIVGDLDRSAAFYAAVCGLTEQQRIDAVVDGRAITEIILGGEGAGPAGLILFRFHDSAAPAPGDSILGFDTDDIDAFVERAIKAGGSLMQAVQSLPEFGLKFAFVRDNEGHLVEVLERF